MNKLTSDARKVSGAPATTARDCCPLCGAAVLYRGLTNLECAGAGRPQYWDIPAVPACPNHKEPPPEQLTFEKLKEELADFGPTLAWFGPVVP